MVFDSEFVNVTTSSNNCKSICKQVFNSNKSSIIYKQLNIICDQTSMTTDPTFDNLQLINHLTANNVKLELTNEFFPGNKLFFELRIFDRFSNLINETIFDQSIEIILNNNELNFYTLLTHTNGTCTYCTAGVYVQVCIIGQISYIHY